MARTAARRVAPSDEPVRPLHEIWADLKRCEAEARDSMARLAEMMGPLLLPPEERPPAPVELVPEEAPAPPPPPAGQRSFDFEAHVAPVTTKENPMPRAATARSAVTTTRAAKKLSREALLVLDAVIVEGKVARIPPATAPALHDLAPGFKNGERLERKLYEEVDAALSALGGKWTRGKVQGHVFDGDPAEAIGAVVETGEFVDAKKLYQFFETPAPLADRLVELAAIDEFHGGSVLEPSAGKGAIVDALLRWRRGAEEGVSVVAVEVQPSNVHFLRNGRYPGEQELQIVEADFLGWLPSIAFERVVMNPPFAGQQDIDHVRHAFDLLRPGGRLVSVMSAGVLFRENTKVVEFRRWCGLCSAVQTLQDSDYAGWGTGGRGALPSGVAEGRIEKLPPGTFAASGTGVQSIVLVLDKAAS